MPDRVRADLARPGDRACSAQRCMYAACPYITAKGLRCMHAQQEDVPTACWCPHTRAWALWHPCSALCT